MLGSREPITRVELSLGSLPRNLNAALAYWESIAEKDKTRPRWKDFDLQGVPPVLLPTTMVYDIRAPYSESVYRFWGSGMTTLYGKDYTGCPVSSLLPTSVPEKLASALAIVCENKSPNAHTPHFTDNYGHTAHQCVLRLPLFDTPGEVTKVVTLIDSSRDAMETFRKVIGEMIDQDRAPKPQD